MPFSPCPKASIITKKVGIIEKELHKPWAKNCSIQGPEDSGMFGPRDGHEREEFSKTWQQGVAGGVFPADPNHSVVVLGHGAEVGLPSDGLLLWDPDNSRHSVKDAAERAGINVENLYKLSTDTLREKGLYELLLRPVDGKEFFAQSYPLLGGQVLGRECLAYQVRRPETD